MSDNKMKPTGASVEEFLATIDESRASEARTIMQIMERITGEPAVLWGASIIGCGSVHYTYESGREGDMPLLGFSPRKANLTIYFSEGFEGYQEVLSQLGPHKLSKVCLYITKLNKVNSAVLTAMLETSYRVWRDEGKK